VFAEPVVRLKRAFSPSAVVKLGYPPSGGGFTASVFWMSANAIRTAGMLVFIHNELRKN
jgi:hypothetical protein